MFLKKRGLKKRKAARININTGIIEVKKGAQ